MTLARPGHPLEPHFHINKIELSCEAVEDDMRKYVRTLEIIKYHTNIH